MTQSKETELNTLITLTERKYYLLSSPLNNPEFSSKIRPLYERLQKYYREKNKMISKKYNWTIILRESKMNKT